MVMLFVVGDPFEKEESDGLCMAGGIFLER